MESIIAAWKKAALELNLELEIPFYYGSNIEKPKLGLIVKQFGSKLGTLILDIDDFDGIEELEPVRILGYYCSALNSEAYENFEREIFIETLTDWGYYGQIDDKPDWYEGHIYSDI